MGVELAAMALFAYGTNESMNESAKARNATERARQQSANQFAAESKKADIQNVRNVRQQIRQTRLAQSSMLNVGAQTGGTGGSGMAGGIASAGSQLGGNLSYMSQIATQNTAIGQAALGYSSAMADASIASSRAQDYSNIASIGSTIFSGVNGYEKVNKYLS
jgi:hypothetical protein